MMSDPERSARTSRYLLIAGATVGVISVVTWFTVGSSGTNRSDVAQAGTCQVPSSATAGTEAPPAFVSMLAGPFGPANTTWTESSGAETVYAYCYNSVDGKHVSDAIGLLTGHGYTQANGDNPTTQTNFTRAGATPYGVSLNVTGDLNLPRPDPVAEGALSIVWTDSAPPAS